MGEAEELDDPDPDPSGVVFREEAGDSGITTAVSSPCCNSVI